MKKTKRNTFRLHDYASGTDIKAGDTVILYSKENVLTHETWYSIMPDNGQGIGGNVDAAEKRYHGWRGTTNDISCNALGCREILSITAYEYDNSCHDFYRVVTVSEDLKPDAE